MNAPSESLLLGPHSTARGTVQLPGSKSISNRILLLAALSKGKTIVRGLLNSDDTEVMLVALQALGIRLEELGADDYRITGAAGDFPVKKADLFLGNAGTAFRPLTAALALNDGQYTLSGVARMHERPIGDLVDGLTELGCRINYRETAGFPPLEILLREPSPVSTVRVRGDVSSQFLTALLMALPLLKQEIRVDVIGELISKPYVEITLNLMARFGVNVVRDEWRAFTIPLDANYQSPGEVYVEGDASSASYFLAAGAIGGGPVRVLGVGKSSIQGDMKFAETLAQMGAEIAMGEDWIEARAPRSGKLNAIDADLNHIPDAAMTIAICALFAEGTTTIRNIASWRVKETDRIRAMTNELRSVGAMVEDGVDFLRVTPPVDGLTASASIATYDDHRMAMSFSLVSLGGVPICINDPGCVAKTFPGYFNVFRTIVT